MVLTVFASWELPHFVRILRAKRPTVRQYSLCFTKENAACVLGGRGSILARTITQDLTPKYESRDCNRDNWQTKIEASFYHPMTNDTYPQDISADESALGFQSLLIDGIGDLMASRIHVVPVPVVAKILDSSDVLIKLYNLNGKIVYSHRRWGRDSRHTSLDHRSWYPILSPVPDAHIVIDNFKTGGVKGLFDEEIIGFPFHQRPA
jgi:hypothetical protein